MSADEQFLSSVRPSPRTQFFFNNSKKKKTNKQKASELVSLSTSSVISKFMFCTHLKVTSCKLALYRLTLPHLQERGQWETKHFMGMALSAPQTPPAKTKNDQNILYRSWDPFLINSFCHQYFKQNEEVLSFLTWVTMSVSHEQTNVRVSGVSSIVETYK